MFNALRRTWSPRPHTPVPVVDPVVAPSPEVQAYGKNPTCQAALAQVNALAWDQITVPACNPVLAERWRIVHQVGIPFQIQACQREIRTRMASDMGFPLYSETEAIRLLTGLEPKGEPMVSHRQCVTAFADSDCRQAYATDHAGSLDRIFGGRHEVSMRHGSEKRIPHHDWQLQGSKDVMAFGHPNDLRVEIPTGILLRFITAQRFRAEMPAPATPAPVPAARPAPEISGDLTQSIEHMRRMFRIGVTSAVEASAMEAHFLQGVQSAPQLGSLTPKPSSVRTGPVQGPLFDEIVVLAPETCFTVRPERPDPLLLGMIGGSYSRTTQRWMHRYCLLGRWE